MALVKLVLLRPEHCVINVHEQRQILRGLKNNKAEVNDGIPSEVYNDYKFASERLLTMMSLFLSRCWLAGKLPSVPLCT